MMTFTYTRVLLASSACLLALLSTADARKPDKKAGATTDQPSCEVSVHPPAVKPGQPVKVNWRTKNASSATMQPALGPLSVGDGKGVVTDKPDHTRVYTLTVIAPDGTKSDCRAAVAVPERTEPRQWPPPAFAGMPADYLARARTALAVAITNVKLQSDQRWIQYATASLLFEQDIEAINDFFANHWRAPQHDLFGFGLFSMDSVRLYGLYHSRGTFPNRLTPAAEKNMQEQLFRVAAGMKMGEYEVDDPVVVWKMRGSENHTMAAQTSYFLVAQFLKNTPELAGRPYEDGLTPAQHYEKWRRFMLRMLDERAKRGLFIEVGSPSYEDESRQAIQNVRDFAEDPVIRKKAEMVLDISYALTAQESINGVRGGAKSRVYSFRDSFWGGASDRGYNLVFGPPGYREVVMPVQATSTYLPPPAVLNIGKDPVGKGTYEMVQRVPGVGARAKDTTLSRDKSVYRYSFAAPGYVMGSFVLEPGETYIGPSSQNRWQGIIFDGDPGARIAPQVTRLKGKELDSEQRVGNGFVAVQDRNVLIVQRWMEETSYSARTDLYFASTLDLLQEEEGWIFVREKNSYAAVKVVARAANRAYEWLDPKTKNKNGDDRKNFVTLAETGAPIIIVANQAADYDNDFDKFKAAIKAQPVRHDGGALGFATLRFHGSQKIGSRDGKQVDISPPRVYDSPFVRSDFASGIVYIRKGDDTVMLDFSKADSPVKAVGGPVTPGFPDGVGKAKPIVFSSR